MNIGLDIDGVLINQEKFQLTKGIKHFKKEYIKKYYKSHGIKLKESDVQVLDEFISKIFIGNIDPITKKRKFRIEWNILMD